MALGYLYARAGQTEDHGQQDGDAHGHRQAYAPPAQIRVRVSPREDGQRDEWDRQEERERIGERDHRSRAPRNEIHHSIARRIRAATSNGQMTLIGTDAISVLPG